MLCQKIASGEIFIFVCIFISHFICFSYELNTVLLWVSEDIFVTGVSAYNKNTSSAFGGYDALCSINIKDEMQH